MHTRPVGPLSDRSDTPDRPIFLERDRHWALVVRQRRAVRPKETPADAPTVAAQFRPTTRKLDGRLVEERNPPGGIGRIDGGGQCIEQFSEVAALLLRLP